MLKILLILHSDSIYQTETLHSLINELGVRKKVKMFGIS
jgi:hypothetical protein